MILQRTLAIQAHSVQLSKTAKSFRQVTLVEIDSNRKYFTKHGLNSIKQRTACKTDCYPK